MNYSSFTMEAHACRIYGMLKATEHQMSIAELSRRLDIPEETVRYIVRGRRWEVRNGRMDSLNAYNKARGEPQELDFEAPACHY